MRYTTTGTGELVIIFGSGSTEFELALDDGALRTLARLTAEALAQLNAEGQPTELVTAAERPT
jgi:hypothetical protein